MRISALDNSPSILVETSLYSSFTIPPSITFTFRLFNRPISIPRLASKICPAFKLALGVGSITSSPVDSTATVGAFQTLISRYPHDASSPISAGPIKLFSFKRISPIFASDPTFLISCPTLTFFRILIFSSFLVSSLFFSNSVYSIITTVLHDGGTGAPVIILYTELDAISGGQRNAFCPANIVPSTLYVLFSVSSDSFMCKQYPSFSDAGNGGMSQGTVTGSLIILPSLS